MITEVALITVSCVLFIQMGLSNAIQEVLHINLPIVSCPKCLTWWTCFLFLVGYRYDLVLSVATSFIASYCALWLTMLYDALALLYNYIYEQITKTQGTSEASERASSPADSEADSDEVPQM